MKNLAYQMAKTSHIHTNDKIDKESLTKKIAVFFTDIVGSTEFFKIYGDEHGMEMLQNHYNTASSVITRFNGHIIKYIGDSIMAYFKNPIDALKAAVHLQQKVQLFNKQSNALSVKIRVGIHYGNVLVEKEDIYGDVVNVASKLTNLAEGDKIYISSELFEQVKDTPFVHFEMIDQTDKKNILDRFSVFSVTWDEDFILDNENIAFFICPIALTVKAFYDFWKNFIKGDDVYIKDKIKRLSMFENDTLIFYLKDPSMTVDVAKYLMDTLRKGTKKIEEIGIVPVHFIIDNINDAKNDLIRFEEYRKYLNPNYIYISEDAFLATGNISIEHIKKPAVNAGSKRFYRLFYTDEKNRDIGPFNYGYLLQDGSHRPCFYCSSKKHKPTQCPTKNLPEITDSIKRLAQYSMDNINSLFFNLLLSKEFQISGAVNIDVSNELKIAYEAFFEPTRVFQLRFLRNIWNCKEQDWVVAKNTGCVNEGGLLWLAQDSLRISDYEKGEACLEKAMENSSEHFKIYCIYALLFIEKDDWESGEKYLKKAIKCAKNKIHKDFLNLLLARLYYLENRFNDALKIINEITVYDPLCFDAYYLGMKIDLQMEKHAKAMNSLTNLIGDDRDYFLFSYIDGELFHYRELIAETLEKIFKRAKQSAVDVSVEAEKEFFKSKNFMDMEQISEIEGQFIKIKNLISQDSFSGYLDATNLSHMVKSKIYNLLRIKKDELKIKLKSISERIDRALEKIKELRYRRFAFEYKAQLEEFSKVTEEILKKIEGASLREIEEMDSICMKTEKEITLIEEKIENLVFLNKVLISLNTFIKYILFSLAMVFLISSLILPALSYHLNIIISKLGLGYTIEVVDYKRYIFLWGGIFGFILSIFASIRKFLK
ncbi:MAG: hypothetical protein N2596_05120 [Syntrophorhabdaceae bacterium]|nr:hypothetical protein [Syntrophorhabdaceae bacterium]